MMKRRITQTIVALLAIVSSATAQTLSVASVEAKAGEPAELVVNASCINGMTALQFNLSLPQGITLNESAITKGSAASGHTLSVQTMNNGDRLIVLYHMDLGLFTNGTLLRLPITAGQQTGTFGGSLSNVRTATTDAVSYNCADATFNITVAAEEQPVTITAENKSMVYGDNVPTLTFTTTGAMLNGTPKLSTTATKTSAVGTYPIKVEKGTVTNTNVTYVDGTLTIGKAPLTVSVGNYSREQGQDNPAFVLTYQGWKNGESESVLLTKPVATTTATKTSAMGDYPITISGGQAQNYKFEYVNGVLTVTASTFISRILASGKPFDVYALSGKKVRRQATSLESLPKGIYIIEGRKVVIIGDGTP